MTDNNQKGALTELQCELFFLSRKILLSKPVIADSRYDYIMDFNGRLYKIQCKSSKLKDDDRIAFYAEMTNIRNNVKSYYQKNDVDFFYTYYNGVSYLIPFDKTSKRENTLRFSSKTPNNPTIKWAKDFEAEKILQQLVQEEVV